MPDTSCWPARPSNRIRPWGELTPLGLIGSTTIDCATCMEKANTLRDGRSVAVATSLVPVTLSTIPAATASQRCHNIHRSEAHKFRASRDVAYHCLLRLLV